MLSHFVLQALTCKMNHVLPPTCNKCLTIVLIHRKVEGIYNEIVYTSVVFGAHMHSCTFKDGHMCIKFVLNSLKLIFFIDSSKWLEI